MSVEPVKLSIVRERRLSTYMQVYGNDMMYAGYVEEISYHPGRDGPSMRLFLRLAGVRKISCHFSWR